MFYPIIVDKKSQNIIGAGEIPKEDFHPQKRIIEKEDTYEVWPIDNSGIEKNWYYSQKRVIENGKNELFCKWVKQQLHIYFNHTNNSEQTYKTVWVGSEYDAGSYGATIVKNITGKDFPFPKSLNTVLDCLKAVLKRKDAVVLDFFAGSGTTGHAVLELNKDGGKRQFILCTNNENNICTEICLPRVNKVIRGYKNAKGEMIPGLGGNLKYYRTAFVPAAPTDKNKELLTKQSIEMLTLKEGTFEKVLEKPAYVIFKNSVTYTGIIFDQLSFTEFKKAISKFNKPISLYIFSLTDDDFSDDFSDLQAIVKICSIPEAILRVYRRIFR